MTRWKFSRYTPSGRLPRSSLQSIKPTRSLRYAVSIANCAVLGLSVCSASVFVCRPKLLRTLCWRVPRRAFRSRAYCCSIRSCRCWSSRYALCSWSARVLRINIRSSCRSRRFSSLICWVWSVKHCLASWRQTQKIWLLSQVMDSTVDSTVLSTTWICTLQSCDPQMQATSYEWNWKCYNL